MNRKAWLDIMTGKDQRPVAGLARLGLAAAEPFYAAAVCSRNWLFNAGFRKPAALPRPVLSVGNITTGGTGKTPMVIELARRLARLGRKPAVLLRGYMPNSNAPPQSDEALLLRAELGLDIPVEPNPDRRAAAADVLANHPQTDLFILDDGFQHRQVHRDLDIVLIDAAAPLCEDHLLPRGLLREPRPALRRAQALILTRASLASSDQLASLEQQLRRYNAAAPILHAAYDWSALRDAADQTHSLASLSQSLVLGVCGVGNPAAFAAMLTRHFPQSLKNLFVLDDHQPFTPDLIQSILEHAKKHNAQAILTTDKDWVKWKPLLNRAPFPATIPIYRPVLGITFPRGGDIMDELLRSLASPQTKSPHLNP